MNAKELKAALISQAYQAGYNDGHHERTSHETEYTNNKIRKAYIDGYVRGQYNSYLGV